MIGHCGTLPISYGQTLVNQLSIPTPPLVAKGKTWLYPAVRSIGMNEHSRLVLYATIAVGVVLVLMAVAFVTCQCMRRRAEAKAKQKSIEEGQDLPIRMSPSPVPNAIVVHPPL